MKPNPKSSHTWHRGMHRYRRWFGLLGFPKGTDIYAHDEPHPIQHIDYKGMAMFCSECDEHITYAKDGRYYHVALPPRLPRMRNIS